MEKRANPKIAGARKDVGVAPVAVIIPLCREEGAIGRVIDALPEGWFERVIVAAVDPNGYSAELARKFGATVVSAYEESYGAACRAGIDYLGHLETAEQPDVVVFINPDFAIDPQQLPGLVLPILKTRCDLVIGSRFLKPQPAGTITLASSLGTKLACFAMGIACFRKHTDVGQIRAVSWRSLRRMRMSNADESWPAEMQIKAARMGLTVAEVPVDCRARNKRASLADSVSAGIKIAIGILRHGVSPR